MDAVVIAVSLKFCLKIRTSGTEGFSRCNHGVPLRESIDFNDIPRINSKPQAVSTWLQ